MKTITKISIIVLLAITISQTYSTTWVVTASGMSFTPSILTVSVGDSIKWEWVSGIHTTSSLALPAGVPSWSAPLDTLHPSYMVVITQPGTYNYQCLYHGYYGMVGMITANPLGVKPIGSDVPKAFRLEQNYPNPFNPSTSIKFDLPKTSQVKLFIYDILGNAVETLVNSQLTGGRYSIEWNAAEFPSGVYFYKLETPDYTRTNKMILVK